MPAKDSKRLHHGCWFEDVSIVIEAPVSNGCAWNSHHFMWRFSFLVCCPQHFPAWNGPSISINIWSFSLGFNRNAGSVILSCDRSVSLADSTYSGSQQSDVSTSSTAPSAADVSSPSQHCCANEPSSAAAGMVPSMVSLTEDTSCSRAPRLQPSSLEDLDLYHTQAFEAPVSSCSNSLATYERLVSVEQASTCRPASVCIPELSTGRSGSPSMH